MKMSMKVVLAAALMLSTLSAQAAFVKADWRSTGDKLVLVDTTTEIEWLNLAVTDDKSIDQVKAELATVYSGWRLPTNAEVSALMYGIYSVYNIPSLEWDTVTARNSNPSVQNAALSFADLMGNGARNLSYNVGLYFDEDGVIRNTGAYANENGAYTVTHGLERSSTFSSSDSISWPGVGGVFLVRGGDPVEPVPNPVPVPAGIGLIGLLALGLAGRVKK